MNTIKAVTDYLFSDLEKTRISVRTGNIKCT